MIHLLSSFWVRRGRRGKQRPVARPGRLQLEALEGRTLLSAATHLAFVQGPGDGPVNVPFSPSVTVQALDAFNKIDTSYNGRVEVSLLANPGQATLGGTTVRQAHEGVVTFDDLTLDRTGVGYTLAARAADPASVPVPRIGLDLAPNSAQPHGEVEVRSFFWGVSAAPPTLGSGGATKAQFGDFQVTVEPGVADPGLLAAVASGKHFPSVVLHVRSDESAAHEFQTYSFSDVVFTAYHTEGGVSRLSLRFGKVQEVELTRGGPVSASVDLKAGKTTVAVPPGGVPQPPTAKRLSLAGVGVGLTVDSFAWGASNSPSGFGSGGGAGKPKFEDFTVVLDPTTLDPVLWQTLATGKHLTQATLTVATDIEAQTFQSFTFADVVLTSYTTQDGQVFLTFRASKVKEEFRPLGPDGTPGTAASASFDLKANTTTGALTPPAAPDFQVVSAGFDVSNPRAT